MADWDEALEPVASKFNTIRGIYGSDALAGYASAKCTNEDNYIFQKFIRTAFGTNNVDYPLLLNTGRILYQYHTCTMSRRNRVLRKFANRSFVLMHPDDASKQNLEDGATVKIISHQGSIHTQLILSRDVLPGECFMPFHYAESPVNALTRDDLDPLSKIAPFKLTACRIVNPNVAAEG